MHIQVVGHEMNAPCLGMLAGQQRVDEASEAGLSAKLGDQDDSGTGLGLCAAIAHAARPWPIS